MNADFRDLADIADAQTEENLLRARAFVAVLLTILVGFFSMERLRRQLNEITSAHDEADRLRKASSID